MSFQITNVLIPTDSGYQTVEVTINGEIITQIIPSSHQPQKPTPSNTQIIDGTHKLLLPGLINAHTHSGEFWKRGAIGLFPLELWIPQLYQHLILDPEKVYLAALVTAIETLLSGGTSIVDHLILIPGQESQTIDAAIRAYRQVGIRAFIAPLIQDQSLTQSIPRTDHPLEILPFYRSTSQILQELETTIQQFHNPQQGISILVAPTGFQLCSDELLKGCITLSEHYQLARHSHLLETRAQQTLAYQKYGCSAVQHLQQIGFLNDSTSLAHSVWLEDQDIQILQKTQATIVHNPLSNLRLGSGIAPILKYRQAGINISFGCDGHCSNDGQDLLETIKIGSILHSVTDPDYRHWITPRQSLEMASLGAAKGLNLHKELGSLTVGKKADLVLYDLTHLSLLPQTDPLSLLLLGRPHNVVHTVWINGRIIVQNGEIQTLNISQLKNQLFAKIDPKIHDYQTLDPDLENYYRQAMNLDPI